MENPRPEKVAVVTEVRERLSGASAALLTEYRGLNVSAMAALRRALRTAGGDYKIYKNTLVRFAARDLGLEIEELLTGPTAIAFVEGDAVTVAKALRDFARTNPALVVKGGLLGERMLSAEQARALADVAPREELLARLAGSMAAPMVQFAGLLQALPRNFAYGLKALIEQQGGVPEVEAEVGAEVEADAATPDTEPATDTEPAIDASPTTDAVATATPTEPDAEPADTAAGTDTEPEPDTEPAATAADDTDAAEPAATEES